ncbi:MAG TPA: type II secretion system major pseudopilin GspG [Verrucomicrobiae bacterium]
MHINIINKRKLAGRFASAIERLNGPASRQGFTIVEILVVCVILAILAATIIPNIVGSSKDAKISAAKSDVSELESSIERFYINMDRYPTSDEGLAALTQPPTDAGTKWHGPYIKRLRDDPWGNPYQYQCPGTHNQNAYDIWSKGAGASGGGSDTSGEIGNW